MRMRSFALFTLPVSLLFAACGSESEVERETGDSAEAEGEILGGTISDEMIPLGHLRSQSPPLKEAPDTDSPPAAAEANTAAPPQDAPGDTIEAEDPVTATDPADASPSAETPVGEDETSEI